MTRTVIAVALATMASAVVAGENQPPGPDGIRDTIPITDYAEVRKTVAGVLQIEMFCERKAAQPQLDATAAKIEAEFNKRRKLADALRKRGWTVRLEADPHSRYLAGMTGTVCEVNDWPKTNIFRWRDYYWHAGRYMEGHATHLDHAGTQAQYGRQAFGPNVVAAYVMATDDVEFWAVLRAVLDRVEELTK